MEHDFDTSLLEEQAESEAKKGMLSYSRWWHSSAIQPAERDYLINNGFQKVFKEIAQDVDGE